MKTIFITERPTQIITALAIYEQLSLKNETEVLVANRFEDASTIVDRFSAIEPHLKFRLVSTYADAIKIAAAGLPAHLFIHWDVGFGTQRRLRRLKRNNKNHLISVFEEGIGTYRQDIYPGFKRRIFSLVGLPVNVGASRYIDDIYVYNKEKYISSAIIRPHKVIQINSSMSDILCKKEAQLASIFSVCDLIKSFESTDRRLCTIYLSNWRFKESDLDGLLPNHGAKVIKLHPYCQAHVQQTGILIAPKSLPAELLVVVASRIFDSVLVFHNGSSVPLYISFENVEFKNLG